MSRVITSEPSADTWSYAAIRMKECLDEFLASPESRRPKKLTTQLSGAFMDLFVPAIFYAREDADPGGKDVPKQVRLHDPSWGIGVLIIATKVLAKAGVEVAGDGKREKLLAYHKFIQRLPTIPVLKREDRTMAEEIRKFMIALHAAGNAARTERFYRPDDDDDD